MCEKTFSASNLIESLKGHNLTGEAKAFFDKLVKDSEGRRAQLEMRPRLLIETSEYILLENSLTLEAKPSRMIAETSEGICIYDKYFSKEEVEVLEGETYSDTVLRHLNDFPLYTNLEKAVKFLISEVKRDKNLNSAIADRGKDNVFTGEMKLSISKVNAPTSTLIQIDLTR